MAGANFSDADKTGGGSDPEVPGVLACHVSLATLLPLQCGVISGIEAPDDDADRLKAMGVCVGRKIELIKPGDPLILRVLGSRIGLSARLARRVMVTACAAPECNPSQAE